MIHKNPLKRVFKIFLELSSQFSENIVTDIIIIIIVTICVAHWVVYEESGFLTNQLGRYYQWSLLWRFG